MKPTAPLRNELSVFATTPSTFVSVPGYPSAIRAFALTHCFHQNRGAGFPRALAVLGTSRRKVRTLPTVPAVLLFNDCCGL